MSTDTGAARLPGIPLLKTSDPALQRWAQAVTEHLEVRAGSRGNPMERVVTQRELSGVSQVVQRIGRGTRQIQPGDLTIDLGGGLSASVSVEQFAQALRESRLYKDMMRRIDDPARFDSLPEAVRALVQGSIAEEAAKRGASIQRLESKLQTTTDSLAYTVEEITAAVGQAAAGVREVAFTSAADGRATAGVVTQVQARLDGAPLDPALIAPAIYATLAALTAAVTAPDPSLFYRVADPVVKNPLNPPLLYRNDGTGWARVGSGSTATIEDVMEVTADRVEGLRAQRTIKVDAGGAMAGIGLAAESSTAGAGTSAIIMRANKLAFISPTDVVGTGAGQINPINPDLSRIPFGVDANGVYVNTALNVKSGTTGVTIAGAVPAANAAGTAITNGAYIYQNSASLYGLYAKNSGGGGTTFFESRGGWTLDCYNSVSTGVTSAGQRMCAINGRTLNGGNGMVGVIRTTLTEMLYAFYCNTGVVGPFTGAHDALLLKTEDAQAGDILVDTGTARRKSVSDTISTVARSSSPNQKGALGVFNGRGGSIGLTASFTDDVGNPIPGAAAHWEVSHDLCGVNALGEGQINVCGEGGNLEIGDLIVTSSMPGKGMRQSDDLVRSTTVAKCREAVTFSSPDEVKLVACIYLCG